MGIEGYPCQPPCGTIGEAFCADDVDEVGWEADDGCIWPRAGD